VCAEQAALPFLLMMITPVFVLLGLLEKIFITGVKSRNATGEKSSRGGGDVRG
jgi:hypothetical protein